jgi:hypothetical protein
MDMSSTTLVVARVDGGDLNDTGIVSEVTSAEEGVRLDMCRLAGWVSTVQTSGVGCPQLDECVLKRLAGPAVDNTDIKNQGYTAVLFEYFNFSLSVI